MFLLYAVAGLLAVAFLLLLAFIGKLLRRPARRDVSGQDYVTTRSSANSDSYHRVMQHLPLEDDAEESQMI